MKARIVLKAREREIHRIRPLRSIVLVTARNGALTANISCDSQPVSDASAEPAESSFKTPEMNPREYPLAGGSTLVGTALDRFDLGQALPCAQEHNFSIRWARDAIAKRKVW